MTHTTNEIVEGLDALIDLMDSDGYRTEQLDLIADAIVMISTPSAIAMQVLAPFLITRNATLHLRALAELDALQIGYQAPDTLKESKIWNTAIHVGTGRFAGHPMMLSEAVHEMMAHVTKMQPLRQ